MKKLLILLTLMVVIVLASCKKDMGSYNNWRDTDEVTYIQVGSKILRLNYVVIDGAGNHIYLLTPKDSTVSVSVETIGFTAGKVGTSVIKIE